jgi:signal transduction histidine kinase
MRSAYRVLLSLVRGLGTRRRPTRLADGIDRREANIETAASNGSGRSRRRGLFGGVLGAAVGRADLVERRPRRGLTWPLRLLLVASLAVPLLLLGVAAWQNLRLVEVQTEQRVADETGQLHEHAVRALETYALILAWIDDRIRGLDWDRIEHDRGLHSFLLDIETLPQINAVSIIDASGHIEASGHPLPTPTPDASDLDTFVAQRQHEAGIYVGHDHIDPRTHIRGFDISRRRTTADGKFDGVIDVAARLDYFSDFFSTVSREKDVSASLLLSDGSVLVRYPPPSSSGRIFAPDTPVMQAIAAAPDHGLFRGRGATDGIRRVFAYERIGGYPLYVVFGIPVRDIRGAWRANLVDYLWFAVPASLGLFCMTLFALRQLQQQKVASWRWRRTAQRLKREMDRRTRAEAELYQSQRMEALGQLTGGVAHDFNNLLTVLQGCLELLSGRQHEDRLQARVDMALGTIERGRKLTGQLLAFARRQPLRVARVDINGLLRRMAELLTQTVGTNIRAIYDLAPDLWPVDTDAAQLELAVINLAINARDAMPEGGQLRLRTFNRTLSPQSFEGRLKEGGDFVGLEISDTGTGMTPEVQARAFEPFFTRKEPGKGTGLGLSMVYGFARQSGGSASIRSEVGRGTTVTLLLPRAKEGTSSNESGATDLPPGTTA